MRSSKKERILALIEKSRVELFPRQVSNKLRLNHSTARKYLRDLLSQGKITQPYKGAYCSKITYGMMLSPLRVHNLIVSVPASWLKFSDDRVEWTGDVKIRVQFGLQRRRITGRISCDKGMSRDTLIFAVNRFYDLVEKKTGHVVEKMTLKTFELNRDYHGVRLDGVGRCFTQTSFRDFVFRVYQKTPSMVRKEVKVSREMDFEDLLGLLDKGAGEFELAQNLRELTHRVDVLLASVQTSNTIMKSMVDQFVKVKERLEKLEDQSYIT